MIRREEGDALWVIHQAAHAYIAGQIATHWIGSGAMVLNPRAELLLTAFNHDAGWSTIERQPHVNAAGKPRTFTEMDLTEHFTIWENSIQAMHDQNRYAGLLTSLHCSALYKQRLRFVADSPQDRARIDAFMLKRQVWQNTLIAALKDHPRYALAVEPGTLAHNLRLVQVWDYLSLVLCMGPVHEQILEDVPLDNTTHATLNIAGDGQRGMTLDPFPLDQPLTLWIDARQVIGTPCADDSVLNTVLTDIPYKPLAFDIHPL